LEEEKKLNRLLGKDGDKEEMRISLEQLKNLRISEMRLQRDIKLLQERESYLTRVNSEWESTVKSLEEKLIQARKPFKVFLILLS
jgi:ABC-type phosphate transport system auxiliary subunit